MQGRLTQAEADLDYAQLALTAGTAAVGRQRDSVAGLISDIYTAGDPELLAFSALLDAQTPEDLIRQDSVRDVIVGRETRAYDDLSAAEVLLDVREGEVQDAKREVAAKARDAAAHVVVMQEPRGAGAGGQGRGGAAGRGPQGRQHRGQGRQAGGPQEAARSCARRTPGSSTCWPSGRARRGSGRCARVSRRRRATAAGS